MSGGLKRSMDEPFKDELMTESEQLGYTVVTERATQPGKKMKSSTINDVISVQPIYEDEILDDPQIPPPVITAAPVVAKKSKSTPQSTMQTCSLCGSQVSDLATHIIDDHTELQAMERQGGSGSKTVIKSPNPVRYKGPFRQVKPVLRFPCDACKTVTKTSEQLKKHMILVHNGHKNTSWMFCGDCEYATRVEDELINHVKVHQIFNVLKEDFVQQEQPESKEADDYSAVPLQCGDCTFTTHYEGKMFLHVKEHMGKKDKYGPVTEEERKKLEKLEKKDAFVIVEGDSLICSFCQFSASDRKEVARHMSKVHGIEVDDEDKKIINVRQSFYYCTLCPFKGKTKADLQEHKMFTIHNKKGGTVTIKHNPLKPKKIFYPKVR